MEFPAFHVPWLGDGMVIGMNAIIHVIIGHGMAIGMFAMIVLGDWFSLATYDRQAAAWERFNRRVLKFVVVVTTTAGAVTGTGIWFTTSGLAPYGIASMLRVFFWVWFTEWLVFIGEVVVILLFYAAWDRLATHRRLRLFWAGCYMVLAVMTAFLITGILGFMLTSGEWTPDDGLLPAFFNPSFFPQLATRLSLAALLGSLMVLPFAIFAREDVAFRRSACSVYGLALGAALTAFLLSITWYYLVVPEAYLERTFFSVLTSRLSQTPLVFITINLAALAFLGGTALAAALRQDRAVRWMIVPALLLAFGLTGEFERIREFIRGPYLIPGFMYANGMLLQEQDLLNEQGLAANSPWFSRQDSPRMLGAQVYTRNCSACHTLDGINSIAERLRGRSPDGVEVLIDYTHEMVSFMPPMTGTPRERRAAARFLYEWTQGEIEMKSQARAIPAPRPAAAPPPEAKAIPASVLGVERNPSR